MTRAVAACLLVGLLAACAGADTGVDAASRSTSSAAANVQDCGSFRQTTPVEGPISEPGASCFVAALRSHQLARLVATTLTTEGDPLTMTYQAMSDGKARVTTDSSEDRFAGGQTLTVATCDGPQPSRAGVLMFAHCTDGPP